MVDSQDRIKLEPSWKLLLAEEFSKEYMQQLRAFLVAEKDAGKTIYPPGEAIFKAFDLTPFNQVRVVIIGQDPYHGPNQAHGLCFSVQPGIRLPPSLQNIYKEIHNELGVTFTDNGCLTPWAQQGVLLLNSVLTVERGKAGSHQGKGWERFTDKVIEVINAEHEACVFMLWGSYAQHKGQIIDRTRHLVLTSPHPSPFSAHKGFFGNGHFQQANAFLVEKGQPPIDWQL